MNDIVERLRIKKLDCSGRKCMRFGFARRGWLKWIKDEHHLILINTLERSQQISRVKICQLIAKFDTLSFPL
jgi:hypothetical protein